MNKSRQQVHKLSYQPVLVRTSKTLKYLGVCRPACSLMSRGAPVSAQPDSEYYLTVNRVSNTLINDMIYS